MEKLIKELIAVEKKRNSLLVELNENLKKLTSKEDKHYEYETGKTALIDC
nr:MAG TPA: hypothetical protein [Caudoviricetes sp.]